jgi:hypothetical protein
MSELQVAYEAAKNVTVVSLLLFFIIGGVRKWWVFGWVYEAKDQECKELKSIVFQQLNLNEGAVEAIRNLQGGGGRRAS